MAARSSLFKAISLLVILVMLMANVNVVQAQDGGPETPTTAPQAELTDTPSPSAPVETVETPLATEAPPEVTETPPVATEMPPVPAETATPAGTPPEPAGALPASFSISGTVTDKDGLGLTGVEVSDDQGHHVQTDESGLYSIDGLAPGKYQVSATLAGLELIPDFRVVNVLDKNVTGVNFFPPELQSETINMQPLPVNHPPIVENIPFSAEGQMESQAVNQPGLPGTSYSLDPSWQVGTTGEPYQVEAPDAMVHFNAPTSLTFDEGGRIWEAEERGNRLVSFDTAALTVHDVLGNMPGISYMDHYTYNSLMAVAYQPHSDFIWAGDTTRLVKYDTGSASPAEYKLQMPDTDPWQSGSDNAHFSEIRGIAFQYSVTETLMYVSDRFNHRIQVFDVSGTTPSYRYTLGVSGVPGNDATHFNQPWHITYFSGFLYVADSQNHRIQKCPVLIGGSPCTTVAGGGDPGFANNQLNTPTAVAVTSSLMYISDSYNHRVMRCDFNGTIATDCQVFAGVSGQPGSGPTQLRWPADVAVLGTHVFVADRDNHRILDFSDPGTSDPGILSHQFGTSGEAYPIDLPLVPQTHVFQPWGIAVDSMDANNLYVAENWGYSLAKFNDAGQLVWRVPTTLADAGDYGSNLHHFGNFSGSNQGNIAIDGLHRIYVPDSGNNRVMIYRSDGTIFGQIGTGQRGSGPDQFACPNGVGFSMDYIFVADTCNQRIQVFDFDNKYVATIGQTGITGADSNHFSNPVALAVDGAKYDIFVVDQGNQRVQRCHIDPLTYTFTYTCTPFAGVTGVSGGRDFHYLNSPQSIAFDGTTGNVLVSEKDTNRIQVFKGADGSYLTTISGEWGDEGGRVRVPTGITINGNGTVYLADSENARILRFSLGAYPWNPVNLNGFGSPFNADITGLTKVKVHNNGTFPEMLYVITTNTMPGQNFSQVWRQLPDLTWQAVSAPGFGSPTNIGLTDMVVYSNSLFVGTYDSSGAQVWRCKNLDTNPCAGATDWVLVPAPTGASLHNQIASRMIVFDDKLFVSYLNWSGSGPYTSEGGEVWAYDGITWTSAEPLLKLDGTTTGTGHTINGIHSMAVSDDGNQLYAGTTDYMNSPSTPAQLYRYAYDTGAAKWKWVRVLENGIFNTHNLGIYSLLDNHGYLYLGTYNPTDGAEIYRYNDIDVSGSTIVVSGGLYSTENIAISAMTAGEDRIYALTTNHHSGIQVLSAPIDSISGLDDAWSRLSINFGFGNATNSSLTSDSSVTFSRDGRLMAGAYNDDNGASLWVFSADRPYHISGYIHYTGPELTNIFINLQPGGMNVLPDAGTGYYHFDSLIPGQYTVTPQYPQLGFTPPVHTVTITTGSVDNVNFDVASGGINLSQPSNGGQLASLEPVTLQWDGVPGGTSYNLQVSNSSSFSPLLKNVTQAATTFKLAGLSAGKTYYWKVRKANNPVGAWSVAYSFKTPALAPPAAPGLQTPGNATTLPAGTLAPTSFTWKPATVPTGSSPVQHYHIQVSRVNTFVPIDIDEYTPDASQTFSPTANLTPNQVYYWHVRAFNTAGDASGWSAPFSFKVLPVPPLTALAYDTNTLQPGFHWTDPYCTGKYLVEVYKSTPMLTRVISKPVTTGTLCEGDFRLTANLLLNTKYEWHITTQGVTGNSKPYTDSFTTPFSVPGVPALSGPANNAILPDSTYLTWQPQLSWNPVSTSAPIVQNYPIQVATQPGFGAYTYIDTPVDASQTSFPLPEALKYNTSVYWRVRACDGNKNCSVWSAVRKLTTRPATPDTLTNTYDSLNVLFRWHDPGGNFAKSYTIVIYSNAACTTLFKSAPVTTNSYSIAVPANKSMCWKVRGIGPSSSITGAYSAPAYFGPLIVLPAPALSQPGTGAVISSSGLNPTEYPDYHVRFTWSGTAGAMYNIQISKKSDFTDLKADHAGFTDPDINYEFSGGKFYWRVRAAGAGGIYGAWSVARNFVTKPQLIGRVRDDMGAPVSDVDITISKVPGVIHPNSSGYYGVDDLPTGTHTLTFTKAGYLTQTRSMSFANGVQYEANATLVPVPAAGLLRIILTWNLGPNGDRRLAGHLWLPTGSATAMHIFDPNVGKADLDLFPHALAHIDANFLGTTYFDIKPQVGKFVFAVNQVVPATTAWSGSTAKVEVYSGTILKNSCALPSVPSGSGSWWYAFDLTVTDTTQTVTCKASLRSASPAPYPDHPISGRVKVADTQHPLQEAVIRYDYGQVNTDPYGKFTINGLVSGGTDLYPEISPANFTFDSSPIPAVVDHATYEITATPISSMFNVLAPSAVTVQGDYAYLGVGRWFYILNIQNKAAPPAFISRLWLGGNIEAERITQIILSGHFAFVVANPHMDVIEITDPLHPTYQTTLAFTNAYLRRTAVSGQFAYLADSYFFYIYNWVENSAAASSLTWSYSKAMGDANGAMDVALQGKYAYLVGTRGLFIFDVTNPRAPVGPWLYPTADPLSEVEVDGNYAYVFGTNTLHILDISDPANIVQVSQLVYPGVTTEMRKSGNFLYLTLYRESSSTVHYGMTIIDVSHPLDPQVRGDYQDALNLLSGFDVSVQEDTAFLVQSNNLGNVGRLSRIDVTDKNLPAEGPTYTPGP